MSYMNVPRVAFRATDAMVNPSTANNNNTINLLDIANVRLHNPKNLDPDAFRAWLMSPITLIILDDNNQPEFTFPSLMGLWNYYGDHAVSFGTATTTSVILPDSSTLLAGATNDPLLGAAVSLNARIVDLDPADNYCSQIIAGTFKVVGQDAFGRPVTLIRGEQPTIASSRWLSNSRPMGAGMFQYVIPAERLEFSSTVTSSALAALRAAALQGHGLVVRYCLYNMQTQPDVTPAYLAEQFAKGAALANPKFGMLAGSFSPWDGQGLCSAPVGRMLCPIPSPFCAQSAALPVQVQPRIKTHEDLEYHWHAKSQRDVDTIPPAAQPNGTAAPVPLQNCGPAVVVVDMQRKVIQLDLLSTFPEVAPHDMTKSDFGAVSLRLDGASATEPQQVTLGLIDYHRETYETFGGVVEVPIAADADLAALVERGQLWVCQDSSGMPLLREITTIQVETDDRCMYLQQGQTATMTVHAYSRGRSIASPARIRLELWRDYNRREPIDETTTPPRVTAAFFGYERVKRGDAAMIIAPALTIPAGGVAKLKIRANQPGAYKIRFIPPGAHVNPEQLDLPNEFFANVRVLPEDNYDSYSDEKINSWSFMYQEVFGYYAILYPVMASIMPWNTTANSDHPERIRTFAALIRQFVDKQFLDSPMYMPITRELSAGKRKLIQRWCDLQLRGIMPTQQVD